MSGLARYLSGVLSPEKLGKKNESDEPDTRSMLYQQSLSAAPDGSPIPSVEASSFDDYEEVLLQTEGRESLTYKQYRDHCNCVLAEYIYKRFVVEKEEDDDDEEDEHEHEHVEMQLDEPSQQHEPQPESQTGWITAKSTSPKNKRPKITLVQNTQHVVHSVSQMDLSTKTLHLSLCRVEKVWPTRLTERMESQVHDDSVLVTGNPDSLLPLLKFGRYTDDGPLFSCYKNVLTMELTQLEAPCATKLHETTSNVYPEAKLYRRYTIYFYNHYAKDVDAFLERNKNCKFYSRLDNVPAACIFPYQQKRSGWFDDDVCDYVLCIGGRSLCHTDKEGGRSGCHTDKEGGRSGCHTDKEGGHLSFDHEDLKIYLLAIPEDPTKSPQECVIDRDSVCDSEEGNLQAALAAWRESHKRAQQDMPEPSNPPQQKPAERAVQQDEIPAEEALSQRGQPANEPAAKRARVSETTPYNKLTDVPEIFIRNRNTPLEPRVYPSATVIGVVVGFNLPSRTKTNNWMMTVAIVDQSLPTDDNQYGDGFRAVQVNIFRKNCEDLPKIRRAGDLLRLKDAGIQDYCGEMQLLGRSNTKISAITREQSTNGSAFQFDGDTPKFGTDELELFRNLWDWGQERIATKATMKRKQRFKLSEVASMIETGDCTVMICGLYETPLLSSQQLPRGFLRVWDGTGAPSSDPLPGKSPAALETIQNGDPPTEALVALHSTVNTLNNSPFCTETTKVLSDIVSVCGSVVNIAVWESPQWEFAKRNFKVGDFIRLRNVGKGTLDSGLICLMALAKSWLVPLPDQTLEVRHMLVDHQLRVERNDPTNPSSGLLPINLPNAAQGRSADGSNDEVEQATHQNDPEPRTGDPISTLATCESGEGLFQCRFSITKILPECKGDLADLCNFRKGRPNYRFAANLVDHTGEVVTVVVGKVGDGLFGISAAEACKESENQGRYLISQICKAGLWWNGTVETRVVDGESYVFLKSAERSD